MSVFSKKNQTGIRVIPWMLIGEVFPVNVRSASSGLSSGLGYFFGFLANYMYLPMLGTLTLSGTFWFYSAVAFTGCIILYFVLPETEGRTLIDIEEHFLGKKSLSVNDLKSAGNENTLNNNNRSNGFDVVTVMPQVITNPQKLNEASEPNGNTLTVNEHCGEHRLSIPDIFITSDRQPGAGSKRYKNRVSDTIRSRNSSITSNDDVQDTRL